MAEGFEFIKLIAMIIALISMVNLPIIYKKNKDFRKYIPGFIFLIMSFTASSLEDVITEDIFEYLEIFSFFFAAITFFIACVLEIISIRKKRNGVYRSY